MMRPMKTLLCVLSGLWLVMAAFGQEDRIVRTYPVFSSQSADVVATLKDVLSEKAKVVFHRAGSQIIVTAPQGDQDVAAAILKELSRPAQNVRIDIRILQEGTTSDAGAAVDGDGRVVVRRTDTGYNVRVNPSVRNQSGSESDNATQTLVMQSGSEGRIFVGDDVPFADWLIGVGRQWGYVTEAQQQQFRMRSIGSSLVVLPQVAAGGLIAVTLTPELSCLVEGRRQFERVRYTRVATQVTVADGATIELGGVGKNQEFYNKFLVGVSSSGEQRSVRISLTAHIQNPQGQNILKKTE